jgi:hypothetical protein
LISLESLRRTKALHILKGTGDLQTVRALLGHARIESTARYLGLETNADPIEVCRAFDIWRCRCPQVPDRWRVTVRRAAREKRKPDDGASIFKDGRKPPSITRYGFAATEGRSIEFGVSVLISSECVVPNGRATFLIDEVSTIGKKKPRRALKPPR